MLYKFLFITRLPSFVVLLKALFLIIHFHYPSTLISYLSLKRHLYDDGSRKDTGKTFFHILYFLLSSNFDSSIITLYRRLYNIHVGHISPSSSVSHMAMIRLNKDVLNFFCLYLVNRPPHVQFLLL